MEKWEEAERDASRSIEMGNACSQKHNRRGQARCNLGNYIGALEDFSQAKEFDPYTKDVNRNIEYCKDKLKRRQSKSYKKEGSPKKAKDDLAFAGKGESLENHQSINEAHFSSSDSKEEGNYSISIKMKKGGENTEAGLYSKTEVIEISPKKINKEKTDKELRLEIEADKEELESRLQAKLDQNLIRTKLLEDEKLKLMQKKLALRNLVERYEDEKKRINCKTRDQGTDPDSGPDSCEVKHDLVAEP